MATDSPRGLGRLRRRSAPAGQPAVGARRGAIAAGGKAGAGKPAAGKPGKAGKRSRPARRERNAQLRAAFTMTRKADPAMVPLVLATFLGVFLFLLMIGFVVGHPIYLGILGFLLGLVAAIVVFGRRAQKAAFRQVEGQPGAGLSILKSMRGNWRVTEVVGFTKQQDMVHRVIGKPGVVLVGEGSPARLRDLIAIERKRVIRVVGDVPVYDVVVGDGEGQVPLKKLQRHLVGLPSNIKPAQVNTVDRRLTAIGRAGLPIPKGPMPKSAAAVPRGKMR